LKTSASFELQGWQIVLKFSPGSTTQGSIGIAENLEVPSKQLEDRITHIPTSSSKHVSSVAVLLVIHYVMYLFKNTVRRSSHFLNFSP
jgi:hypothetical protein